MAHSGSRIVVSTPRQWSFLAGVAFAVVGLLAALSVMITPIFTVFYGGVGLSTQAFPLLVAVATGLVGGLSWWVVVERPGRPTRERGAIVGMLSGILVHPVAWILILSVQDLQAGRWPLTGSGAAFSLFLYWGVGLVGAFTVIVGVACGLLFTVVRGRFGDEEVSGRSLPVVGASAILTGWLTVALLMATVGVYVGGLLAAGVTLLALRRLPVVRTFLSVCYRLDDSSSGVLSEVSFRSRHVVAVSIVGTVGFFGVAVGYALVVTFLYYEVVSSLFHVTGDSIWYALWERRLYVYPAVFVIINVPIAVIVNRYVNHCSPAQSIRRTVIEWSAFFVLVSFSYTVVILILYSWTIT